MLREAAAAEGAHLGVLRPDARSVLASLVAEGDRTQFADPRWRRVVDAAGFPQPKRGNTPMAEEPETPSFAA
jgi:hypothetical protein